MLQDVALKCCERLARPLVSCLGNMQCPQEHLKIIVYAKFGGQTKCIMGNSKIENGRHSFVLEHQHGSRDVM